MDIILTTDAPAPGGHYSQAITHAGLVYVAGQLPIDPRNGEKSQGDIETQTQLALENLRAVLQAAGSDLDHVLKVTVYIADIGLWDRVNTVYARCFGDHRPARSVVPTNRLHFGLLIEIDAIAAIR